MDGMESLLNAWPRRFRTLGWAALFPLVMLVFTVYFGARPWTWTVVLAAGAITLLAPAVAADLLPVALIGLAAVAFALTQRTCRRPTTTTAGSWPSSPT
jgi:hypothetical protein